MLLPSLARSWLRPALAISMGTYLGACNLALPLDDLANGTSAANGGGGSESTSSSSAGGQGATGTTATATATSGVTTTSTATTTTSTTTTTTTTTTTGVGGSGGGTGSGGAGSAYATAVIAAAPEVYLRLGEADGPLASDAMGNGDGVYRDSVILGRPGAIEGDPDTAVRGTTSSSPNGAVSLGDILDFSGDVVDFSLELWVHVLAAPSGEDQIQFLLANDNRTEPEQRRGYLVALMPDGEGWALIFERYAEDDALGVYGGTPFPIGRWVHVVARFSQVGSGLFVDGESLVEGGTSIVGLSPTTEPFIIGADSLGNFGFAGEIDEVAVYGRELSDAEIRAHHELGQGR